MNVKSPRKRDLAVNIKIENVDGASYLSIPWCTPTYVLDENSLTPYKEIEVSPLAENSTDNDFNDKEVYDDGIDDDYKDPN